MNSVKPIKTQDAWIEKRWRPIMAFTYIVICVYDFILAPTGNYLFFYKTGQDYISWKPLTMVDGGLFHVSMGAILGIAAWTRGQEKITRYGQPRYDESEYEEDRASHRDRLSGYSSREDR